MVKKKQKSSCKKLQHRNRAKRLMQNVLLQSWESSEVLEGDRTCQGIAKIMGVERQLNQRDVNLIVKQRLNWTICCRALCELNGEVWVETEIVAAKDIMVNDFAEHYDKMREQVLACVNKVHVVDVGWICHTFGNKQILDTNFELTWLGEVSDERRQAWKRLYDNGRAVQAAPV